MFLEALKEFFPCIFLGDVEATFRKYFLHLPGDASVVISTWFNADPILFRVPLRRHVSQLRTIHNDGLLVGKANQDDARRGEPESSGLVPDARRHARPANHNQVSFAGG